MKLVNSWSVYRLKDNIELIIVDVCSGMYETMSKWIWNDRFAESFNFVLIGW